MNHQCATQLFVINVPMVKHPLRLHPSVCVNVKVEVKVMLTYTFKNELPLINIVGDGLGCGPGFL